MNAARTAFQCDMVAHDDGRQSVIQRMLRLHTLQFCTGEDVVCAVICNAGSLHNALHELVCHDIILVAVLDERIVILRSETDGKVAGDRPCGRRPDDEEHLVQIQTELCEHALVVSHAELDKDGVAGIVLVLDLCLGKCGVAVRAPVNGLQTLVEIAVLHHLTEHLDLTCLVLRTECQIGMIVVTNGAQTLELLLLVFHMRQCKILTCLAEVNGRDRAVLHAHLLECLELDGKSVGIPAGHIGGIEAGHVLLLDDEILEHLVQRRTDMNGTVGIGRAVMEHETGLAHILLHHRVI